MTNICRGGTQLHQGISPPWHNLTTLNRASEEVPAPEVANIISTIDNHLHYQDTTNMQIGLILTFIPIKNRNYNNTSYHDSKQT